MWVNVNLIELVFGSGTAMKLPPTRSVVHLHGILNMASVSLHMLDRMHTLDDYIIYKPVANIFNESAWLHRKKHLEMYMILIFLEAIQYHIKF